MLSKITTLVIGIGSIYFFYEYNFFIGVILLVWLILRLLGVTLQKLGLNSSIINNNLEKTCNVYLSLRINVENVLKHEAVNDLYEKLKKNKKIKENNNNDWIKKLLSNYKKVYKNDNFWEEVKFNIKNNLLWKNEKIDFNDDIYYEIKIPYEYSNRKKEGSIFGIELEDSLTIRIFVINGIIKLQIGEFSKEYTPEILKDGGLAAYKTYETITSFPLIYFSFGHKIPQNYLNISFYATEFYKNKFIKLVEKKNVPNDWVKLNRDLKNYNYVCSLADEHINDGGKWQKIVKNFNEEKDNILRIENFKNPFARDDSEDDYFAREFLNNSNIYYQNNYLVVNIDNINDYKEKKEKYTYTDYWEEMP